MQRLSSTSFFTILNQVFWQFLVTQLLNLMLKFSSLQQVLRGCKNICLGIGGCQPEIGDRVFV